MFKLGFGSYNCAPDGEVCAPVVNVGKYTSIAQGCKFLGKGAHLSAIYKNYVANYPFDEKEYVGAFPPRKEDIEIHIGNDVWIGFNSVILNGVHIGDGAIIGAGTMVSKDVPPYSVFIGNPGRSHHFRFPEDIVNKLLKIKWWDWDNNDIRNRIHDFEDITSFVKKYG